MVIMYLGPHRHPDFEREYYISPLVAPDYIIAQMPPVYMICGERDPLVDDSIRFAARIRQAKLQLWKHKQASSTAADLANFNEDQHVRLKVVEGSSHGFLQLSSLFPPARTIIRLLGGWLEELLYNGKTSGASSVSHPTGIYSNNINTNEGQDTKLVPASSISADERQYIEQWQKSGLIHEADLMDRRNQHIYEKHVLSFGQNNISTV
jgi:hypothetical protein